MSVFAETFFGPSVIKLKQQAYELKAHLDYFCQSWFSKWRTRRQLVSILDEIDYQEGRKQFANRPYSFRTISMHECTGNPTKCRCGCWQDIREQLFRI